MADLLVSGGRQNEIRGFLDGEGKPCAIPAKRRKQLIVLFLIGVRRAKSLAEFILCGEVVECGGQDGKDGHQDGRKGANN